MFPSASVMRPTLEKLASPRMTFNAKAESYSANVPRLTSTMDDLGEVGYSKNNV